MKPNHSGAEEPAGAGHAFPTHMLPPPLRAMVLAIHAVHGVPEVMPAAIALAMISAAIRKGLRIASGKGRHTMANLYALISAESGTCKSTSLGILIEPLQKIQECEASSGIHPEEASPRLICSDTTGPALAKLLAANGETTLNATAEAGNLLNLVSKPANPLGQLLLKGYSGDPVEIDRMNRKPVVIKRPCITVCWLCQPHRIDKFLGSEHLMEDGLLARFLVAHSGATMAYMTDEQKVIPEAVSASYGNLIHAIFEAYGRHVDVPLTVDASEGAFAVLQEYHNLNVQRWNAENGLLRCCIARWSEQAWRMTLVLHAARHGGNSHRIAVELDTAGRAVALQEWFVGQQVSIIGGTTRKKEGNRLEKLCELLMEAPDREMKLRDLRNSHGFSHEEVRRLVGSAPSKLNLQDRQNSRGGPRSFYVVLAGYNP
jgi:Protein of unknown function (DUF3987)